MIADEALVLDAAVVECGETLTGTLADGEGASVVLVGAVSRIDEHDHSPEVIEVPGRVLGPGRRGDERFEVVVPPDGPITFEGKLLSAAWCLVVRASDGRDLTSQAVVVLPSGGVGVWAREAALPPDPR